MADIITVQGLTKVYRGKVTAVDHISFQVREGEIFGFLGPNGARKTTTIKMLNTLASITEGTASVAGHDVSKEAGEVRKVIGVVPQELTADDELSGRENMVMMANLHQVWRSYANSKIDSLLALVDLQEAAGRVKRAANELIEVASSRHSPWGRSGKGRGMLSGHAWACKRESTFSS